MKSSQKSLNSELCLCGCGKTKSTCSDLNRMAENEQSTKYVLYHEISMDTMKDYVNKIITEEQNATKSKCDNIPKKKCNAPKYYQFGLIAKVDATTTDIEVKRLLKFDFRTFVIQTAYATRTQLDQIMLNVYTALENFKIDSQFNIPIGLAVEIRSDVTRLGRLRNNAPDQLTKGHVITLTANEDYSHVSMREILYVSNLWRFLKCLKIGNTIFIDNKNIILKVIKTTNRNITVCVEQGGKIESYMEVDIPYYSKGYEPSIYDCEDVKFANDIKAHFLIIPKIRSYTYVRAFKTFYSRKYDINFEIIGKIDLNFLKLETGDIYDIIQECNAIWVDDLLLKLNNKIKLNTGANNLLKIVQNMNKPVIASIPIETRKDFNILQKLEIFNSVDSFLIEKSKITNTFPIIAKKLLPLPKNYNQSISGDSKAQFFGIKNSEHCNLSPQQALINCLKYTINSISCSGIVITTCVHSDAMFKLANSTVYCPVIVVVDNFELGKTLNLYRNLKAIVMPYDGYNKQNREAEFLKYGMQYGKFTKLFTVGDFVMTFNDSVVNEILWTNKVKAMYLPREIVSIEQRNIL